MNKIMLNNNRNAALLAVLILASTVLQSNIQTSTQANTSTYRSNPSTSDNSHANRSTSHSPALYNNQNPKNTKQEYSHILNPIPNLWDGIVNHNPKQFGKGLTGTFIWAAIFYCAKYFYGLWDRNGLDFTYMEVNGDTTGWSWRQDGAMVAELRAWAENGNARRVRIWRNNGDGQAWREQDGQNWRELDEESQRELDRILRLRAEEQAQSTLREREKTQKNRDRANERAQKERERAQREAGRARRGSGSPWGKFG